MGRTACVDLPAFPLQLLLRRHPDWAPRPAVVVDRDQPQGVIRWANREALRHRILPGMRYAAALSLAHTLHAGEMPEAEIEAEVARVADRLRSFSPDVEPARGEPGVFWLGAAGIGRLHPSLPAWARQIRSRLGDLGLQCRVAVGFTRFGTYAAARAGLRGGLAVFRREAEERAAARQIQLRHLGLAPRLRDELARLGIHTVGAFLELPAAGLRQRFGPEAQRLHELASGRAWAPLEPVPEVESLSRRADLDVAEGDVYRLLFWVKRLLDPLLETLAARREALTELRLTLQLDAPVGQTEARTERVRPASPTLDARQLLNLVHLRLEAVGLGAGVESLELDAASAPASAAQLALFADRPRRDPAAADRALARIRAELGDGAVVRAKLRDGHLPEARFAWEPLDHVASPAPRDVPVRPLVRRVYARPRPLPPRARHEADGWLLIGDEHGHVVETSGPYLVSGGWWRRPVHREYHFARMREGELLWIYYDRVRRFWFLQGEVL